jgi:hypothetical protein
MNEQLKATASLDPIEIVLEPAQFATASPTR